MYLPELHFNTALPTVSVGAGYDLAPRVNLNATYNSTWGGASDMGAFINKSFTPADVSSVMAGLTYTFNNFTSPAAAIINLPNHFYTGVQGGFGTINAAYYGLLGGENGFAYGVLAGYSFPLSSRFSIGPEIGFTQYPTQNLNLGEAETLSLTGYAFNFLAAMKYYIDNNTSVMLKAGGASVQETIANFAKVHELLPAVSLGAGYDLTSALNLNVTYNTTWHGSTDLGVGDGTDPSHPADVSVIMAGLTYNFGA